MLLYLSYIATQCLRVCMFVCLCPISSGTAGPIWLNFFLLAPSWSRDGFRPKKFRIWDPDFPEIRKNPDFRVFFDQFGWNSQVILTLTQICFNTNKFLDQVSVFTDPKSSFFSRKIRQDLAKSSLTGYHDVIHHFSYSDHGNFIFGIQFAIWRIFSKFLEDFSR